MTPKKRISKEQREELVAKWNARPTQKKLAQEFGISIKTVGNIILRARSQQPKE